MCIQDFFDNLYFFSPLLLTSVLCHLQEKVSRVERVVGEHQLFSQGLEELQNCVTESQQVLKTCRSPTSDKSVLITRMDQLEVHLLYRCDIFFY